MKKIVPIIGLAFIFSLIAVLNLFDLKNTIKNNSIRLNGKDTVVIDMYDNYVEQGASFLGSNDFNSIDIVGDVDTNKKGTYVLNYVLNNNVAKRTIVVKDSVKPVITLRGNDVINVKLKEKYVENGYIAIDNSDGNITNNVIVKNNVNYNVPGSYRISYTVSDEEGNTTTVYRTVNVQINGSRYIIISISKQRLWFYKNGRIFLETSIVSGHSNKTDTYKGTFKILAKATHTRLKTKKYNVPVDYWMQFKNGQGLHDAKWRNRFGGNIYKYGGSHGCVNLPLWAARAIYNNAPVGTTIFIY